MAVLLDQLPGQAPAHADVAVVVDDAAEEVPGREVAHAWGGRGKWGDIVVRRLLYTCSLRQRERHAVRPHATRFPRSPRGAATGRPDATRTRRRPERGGFRCQGPHRPPAQPAGRLPLLRCAGQRALRREGTRSEEARLELFHQDAAVAAHRDDGGEDRAYRDHRGAQRGRGAAAGEQPDQGAGAALQHPVPRRQVVPLPEAHAACVSAHGVLPRRDRSQAPVLRPVPERACGAREHADPAEGVPAAHVRGHGVQ